MGRIALYDEEATASPRQHATLKGALVLLAASVAALLLYADLPSPSLVPAALQPYLLAKPYCPKQPDPIAPPIAFTFNESYRETVAGHLAAAVRVKTINYDDMGKVDEDPRWHPFYELHDLLNTQYADLYAHPLANLTLINKLGRITTIQGSDSSLQPVLLMAHQDVVPVERATEDQWTYPPFAGHVDGDYVTGRGSCDCKALLIAQLDALRLLLKNGWQPRRTIVIASGFDEETTGQQGAKKIMEYLESLYGKYSMLMVIDEGTGSERIYGHAFSVPATAEKGYLDVKLSVGVPGGHSSVPPKHTAIGLLAKFISAIEDEGYPSGFSGTEDPLLQFQICAAENAPKYPKFWRDLVRKADWNRLAKLFSAADPENKALISTTQAVDLLWAGSKINSLPERATAVINHRIQLGSSVTAVKKHIEKVIRPVADAFNLTVNAFGSNPDAKTRFVELTVFGEEIEPAPRTPTSGPIWDLFAGSVRHVLKDDKNGGKPYTVSPFYSSGNTDTQRAWILSKHIYRYVGSPVQTYAENAHTVDEKMSISDLIKIIEWVYTIVQNADTFNEGR